MSGDKNCLNRLWGGRGVRSDKVVTSNLAFARARHHISLSAAAGITFLSDLVKNGEDKQCGISLGGQMIRKLCDVEMRRKVMVTMERSQGYQNYD